MYYIPERKYSDPRRYKRVYHRTIQKGRIGRMGASNRGAGVSCAALAMGLMAFTSSAQAADKVDYTSQIKPLLTETCVKCHSLDNPRKQAAAGLRLDDRDLALKGGK